MAEKPAAEMHADAINIELTPDGHFARLTLVNQAQGLSVSLPRPALESLQARIATVLREIPCAS